MPQVMQALCLCCRKARPSCWLLARMPAQLPQVVEHHRARDQEGLPRLQPVHCIGHHQLARHLHNCTAVTLGAHAGQVDRSHPVQQMPSTPIITVY